ncbi:C2 family cysteine protease [soil metagenome]
MTEAALLETNDGVVSGDKTSNNLVQEALAEQAKVGTRKIATAASATSSTDLGLPELTLFSTPENIPQTQREAIKPGQSTPMPDGSWNVRNADGSESKHQTDGSIINVKDGKVTSVTNTFGVSQTFEYDQNGNVISIKGSNSWNNKNGEKATVDGHGNYTIRGTDGAQATHNADGTLVTESADGRNIKVRQIDGSTRTFERGADGKITSITEANGNKWTIGSDGQYHETKNGKETGRVNDSTPELDKNGNYKLVHKDGTYDIRKTDGSEVSYDKNKNVTKVVDQNGQTRSFEYNENKLAKVHDNDGTDWILDDVGNWRHEKKGENIGYTTQSLSVDSEGNFKKTDNKNGTYELTNTRNLQITYDPHSTKPLFGDSGDPKLSIKPDNVRQGTLGDCYFEAALASLAGSNPEAVKNMIKDNNDGTYTVTFPGDPKHPVIVETPSVRELETYGRSGGDNSAWAAIVEKAHRQYSGKETDDAGDTVYAGLDLLSTTGTTTYQFSNLDFKRIGNTPLAYPTFGASSRTDVERALREATTSGRPVVASTSADGAQWLHIQNGSGDYVGGHVYSVTNYDPKSGQVTIRNPWGRDDHDNGNNGYFTMSLDDFIKNFSNMAVQNQKK